MDRGCSNTNSLNTELIQWKEWDDGSDGQIVSSPYHPLLTAAWPQNSTRSCPRASAVLLPLAFQACTTGICIGSVATAEIHSQRKKRKKCSFWIVPRRRNNQDAIEEREIGGTSFDRSSWMISPFHLLHTEGFFPHSHRGFLCIVPSCWTQLTQGNLIGNRLRPSHLIIACCFHFALLKDQFLVL